MISFLTKPAKCTIVVPIKDNPSRTREFLARSIFSDFEYIFADGSIDSRNEILFQNEKRNNIKYIKYPPDDSISNFYLKMVDASSHVRTKYVINIDQGDIILKDGINAAINALDSSKKYSTAAGNIYAARAIFGCMTLPYLLNSTETLSDRSFTLCSPGIKSKYSYIWYSVQRKEIFQKMWEEVNSLDLRHPFLEYFPTLFTLNFGHHKYLDTPMLIRKIYGPMSWTRHSKDFSLENISIEEGQKLTHEFANSCENIMNIPANLIYETYIQNALEILAPSKSFDNYGLRLLKLDSISRILFKIYYPKYLLRVLSHYSKLILPASDSSKFFTIFSWRKIKKQIQKL